MLNKIQRLPEVIQSTGLSRSTIYAFMQEGTFPKPIKLGPRRVGWIQDEVTAWIEEKIRQSRTITTSQESNNDKL